jgi:hypothetical protein
VAEFDVELVGGPYAGRRSLKSRRRHPPEEIPVLVRPPDDGDGEKTFAIYRYSHRDEERDALVYSYAHVRDAPRRLR